MSDKRVIEISEGGLRAYFEGETDSIGVREHGGGDEFGEISYFRISDSLDRAFEVKLRHLIRVCDSYLGGCIGPKALQAIRSTLTGSDWFEFNSDSADDPNGGEDEEALVIDGRGRRVRLRIDMFEITWCELRNSWR